MTARHENPRSGPSKARRLAPLVFDRAGNVTLEFAFIAVFLATLMLGAIDFGRFGIELSRVTSASRAGTQFGMQDMSAASDVTRMVQAALTDAGVTGESLTVGARQYCQCAGSAEVACSSTCVDGAAAPWYVEVTVQEEFPLLFDYPGLPPTLTLNSTNAIRVR
ncbi:MAG: TadE/TadG family type IV pilus assembly protein [Alphaproteobacteria bacterium]